MTKPCLASALALLLTACGGGGGGDTSAPPPPSFGPTAGTLSATPTSVFATQPNVTFLVTGVDTSRGYSSSSFTAKLGNNNCGIIFVMVDDTVRMTCTAPATPLGGTASLQLYYKGSPLGSAVPVTLVDPATQPAPAFSSPTIVSSATWGSNAATVTVTGGQNLFGRSYTATVAGMPCSGATVQSSDLTRLNLTCPTPPGNAESAAVKVVVRHADTILTPGLSHAFTACAPVAAPAQGVASPQFCNAGLGSLAAAGDSTRGIWQDADNRRLMLGSDGSFLARRINGYSGGSISFTETGWTSTSSETLADGSISAYNTTGTFTPFRSISDGITDGMNFIYYGLENALAADQAALTGLWGAATDPMILNIAANGSYTGTTTGASFGTCALTGTITHDTVPAPKANLFKVTMVATGASCSLLKSTTMTGLGSIGVFNVGTTEAPVLGYGLQVMVRKAGQAYVSALAVKQ